MRLAQDERNGIRSEALYSDCGAWRYSLSRRWQAGGGELLWIMLNPSTATEMQNDPTIERCERRGRAGGFGGFRVVNLFAFRATRPRDLFLAADPVGPENDAILDAASASAAMTLCAWGNHGVRGGRAAAVLAGLRARGIALYHLGLTGAEQPRHPLYTAYAQGPIPWD